MYWWFFIPLWTQGMEPQYPNCICGVMVSMLTSSVVERGIGSNQKL